MDDFRKEQKKCCGDGTKNKRGIYGCPCCRKIKTLGLFKQWSRKLAKRRLRRKLQDEIHKELENEDSSC
jgi:hypothetical protein